MEAEGNYVNGEAVQSTLREMREQVTSSKLNGILLIAGLVLMVLGPFRTAETMLPVPRTVYWVTAVFGTYYAAAISGIFVLNMTRGQMRSRWTRIALASLTQSIAVLIIALGVFVSTFGLSVFLELATLTRAVMSTVLICFLMSAGFMVVGRMYERLETDAQPSGRDVTSDSPKILSRLDFAKRGALVSLSVQDHYVEVTTIKGKSLILLRFIDGLAEVSPVNGVQIHRSHWVALDGIADVRREGKKVVLTTTAGDRLPVSRTYLPDLKQRELIG